MKRDLGSNCLDEGTLEEIALGVSPPEKITFAVQHAARCDLCGSVLRRYIGIFSDEVLPKEATFLNQLQSSNPEWQRQWLRQHAIGSAADGRKNPSSADSSDEPQEILRIPPPAWPWSRWWKRTAVASGV